MRMRDLSLGLFVCSGASNAADMKPPWLVPQPQEELASSGHPVGEGLMIFHLVLQVALGYGKKTAFSFKKEVFLNSNHLPREVC